MINIYLNPTELLSIKKITDYKNKLFNYNNIESKRDVANRWIGLACEYCFNRFLKQNNIEHKWNGSLTENGIIDFEINGKRFEMKALSRAGDVKYNYAVDFNCKQFIKTKESKLIDYLVFASYNLTQNKCQLIGFISLEDFIKNMILRKKGQVLYKFLVTEDFYELSISKLIPIEKLYEK